MTVTRVRRKSIPVVKAVVPTVPATAAERSLAAPVPASKSKIADAAWRYQVDFGQRVIMFLDILRERANNMPAHEQAGMPPVLSFDYDTILDARTFERPVNYALIRITGSGGDHIEDCVDKVHGEVKPKDKLDLVTKLQSEGAVVAMAGALS